MKVRELIEALQKMPHDREVLVWDEASEGREERDISSNAVTLHKASEEFQTVYINLA